MIRSSNPTFSKAIYGKGMSAASVDSMTISGAVNKCFIMLALMLASAFYVWNDFVNSGQVTTLLIPCAILGLILALITCFKHTWAPYTSPLYALCEGVLLGGMSAMLEAKFPGIAIQAVGITFATFLAMLLAYRGGFIRATEKFKSVITAATLGIMLVYVASMILGFFGTTIPMIHESGIIGIGFSLFVVVIAALNLVLDFDSFEQCERARAPKHMEWYCAFGLTVTLVWLYFEVLILLAKLRSSE